jgi:transposase
MLTLQSKQEAAPDNMTAAKWRDQVRAHFGDRRRTRYPEALRRSAASYLKRRQEDGSNLVAVAQELGVDCSTLQRWSEQCLGEAMEESSRGMVPVVLRAEAVAPEKTKATVVVHGPRGLRVEGLSVVQIAQLMEALTC